MTTTKNKNFKRIGFYCLLLAGFSFYLNSCNNNARNKSSDAIYGTNSTDSAGNLNKTKFGPTSSKLQSADYLVDIYSNSLFILKLSQDALAHEISTGTKNAASYLVKKQTAFDKEMRQMADELGVSLPGDIDKDQKKELADLQQRQGPTYEQNYFNLILSQQKKALSALKAAQDSNNETISNWAEENTPRVETYIDTITSGQKRADSLDVKQGS